MARKATRRRTSNKPVQLPWPISVGLWFIESPGGDRFTSAYKKGIPVIDRIHLAGTMRGVRGVEMHYPYEVDEDNFEDICKAAKDEGLRIVTICPGLFNEPYFKDGAFTSKDRRIRRKAVERFKTAMRMDAELRRRKLGGDFAIYWPAADGCTYTLDSYHPDRRKMMRDCLVEVLESVPGKIAVEHKPSDPAHKTYSGTTGETILLCKEVQAKLGTPRQRIGMNPELAHLLMADADIGADISLILENKLLLHTHWNTIKRLGPDTDLMVGTDNWNQTMEVFFWLDEFKYDHWLGLDLCPKSEYTPDAVDVSIEAMERMYAEVMSIKDQLKRNMRDPKVDATANQRLVMRARGARYTPLK